MAFAVGGSRVAGAGSVAMGPTLALPEFHGMQANQAGTSEMPRTMGKFIR